MRPLIEATNLKEILKGHPLTSFFAMAYLFSWIVLIPYILSQWNIIPRTENFDVSFALNAFVGPMLASFIMIRLLKGKGAIKAFRKSIWKFKLGFKWYLFALVVIPAVMYLGFVILNGGIPTFEGLTSQFYASYPVYFIAVFFGGGPFPEEIGWRGFALPRMQSKFGPLRATLLLGILWAFWHLPHFLTTAQRGGPGSDISLLYFNLPIFIVLILAISIILTWVFNSKRGNLFIVMLVHASVNAFGLIQPHLTNSALKESDLAVGLGLGLLALIILIVTKGDLGYKQFNLRRKYDNQRNLS